MKIVILALLVVVTLATGAQARGGFASRTVEVWVVVPANAQTTVTASEAVAATGLFLDEINAWFSREIGRTFTYRIQTLDIGPVGQQTDACGSFTGTSLYGVLQNTPIGLSAQDRSMVLMLGAGGWAGHFSPADRQVPHFGMVGDWGVMEQYDRRVSCIPDWDYPNRGFSHEFAGMMGMYVNGGCYGDGQGCFLNDPMSTQEKADLVKYSGKWLD